MYRPSDPNSDPATRFQTLRPESRLDDPEVKRKYQSTKWMTLGVDNSWFVSQLCVCTSGQESMHQEYQNDSLSNITTSNCQAWHLNDQKLRASAESMPTSIQMMIQIDVLRLFPLLKEVLVTKHEGFLCYGRAVITRHGFLKFLLRIPSRRWRHGGLLYSSLAEHHTVLLSI